MQIVVGNIVYVLTDNDQYIRLDKIDNIHIAGRRVKCFSGGTFFDLTADMIEPGLTEKLNEIKDAQAKYTPIVQLCTRYSYAAGKKEYKGTHSTINPSTADANWTIMKYSYSGNDLTIEQGPLVGAWDNRASLAWGS